MAEVKRGFCPTCEGEQELDEKGQTCLRCLRIIAEVKKGFCPTCESEQELDEKGQICLRCLRQI